MAAIEMAGLLLLALASLATLVYWSVVLYHIVRTIILIPTARRGLSLSLGPAGALPPRICVIVPAHNEEAAIADVARTLSMQDYPSANLRCVFVLDRCTDRTRAVLEAAWKGSLPPTIIELDSCPSGWVGKSHAVWSGATTSDSAGEADLLLFIDADTVLHPGAVRAAAALLHHRRVGMLSLLSTLTHRHWFEKLVQPAAAMELMRQYPIVRANTRSPARRRAFANGQFILIRRDLYFTIGGHQAIRDRVLEDVELARLVARDGTPAALLLASGLVHCRMYESYEGFVRGWKRILGESAGRKPARLRKTAFRLRVVSVVLPLASAAAIALAAVRLSGPHHAIAWLCLALGIAGLSVHWLAVGVAFALGRTPLWAVPGFALGSWLVGGIMHRTARDLDQRLPTVWGGREYVREAQ